jgi:hypothetical protein
MTTFYRGEDAFITHEVFEARSSDFRSFLIRELTGVHVVHETHDAFFPRAVVIGVGAIILAIAVVHGSISGPSMWTVLALAAVLSTTITIGCARTVRTYELRATYRGRPVCLLRTQDLRVLGQVVRALRRAAEWNLERR